MAYQALYRKYRSQRFDEMVGQEVVATTLKNAIVNGQISHAYLLVARVGQGKLPPQKFCQSKSTARIKKRRAL